MKELIDFLWRAQRRGEVRFMLIGGRGLAAHGYQRNTKDIDFIIAHDDIPAMEHLLGKVGYTKTDGANAFSRWRHTNLMMEEVDLMFVDRTTFEKLSEGAVPFAMGAVEIQVPSVQNLVALKLHAISNNPDRLAKDFSDIVALRQRHPESLTRDVIIELCHRFVKDDIRSKVEILLS